MAQRTMALAAIQYWPTGGKLGNAVQFVSPPFKTPLIDDADINGLQHWYIGARESVIA
jgi:hypothetical protein